MTTTAPKLNSGMKLRVNHDYISLSLGNNRTLTANRRGGKVSGSVPDSVTDAWFKVCDGKDGNTGTLIERITLFANDLSSLWSDWNIAPDTDNLKVGVRGKMFLGKRKGFVGFEIVELPKRKGGTWTVKFDNENHKTRVPADMLVDSKFGA
jgi:hypothetical protein